MSVSLRLEVADLAGTLGRIEQKLDDLIASFDAYQTAVKPARRATATK